MNIAATVRHTWTQPCTVTSQHERCRGASWKEIFPPKARLPSMASSLQTKRESLHQSKDKGKLPTSRKAGRSLLNYPNLGQANKIIQFLKNAGNSCRNFSIPQKYYCAMFKQKPCSNKSHVHGAGHAPKDHACVNFRKTKNTIKEKTTSIESSSFSYCFCWFS